MTVPFATTFWAPIVSTTGRSRSPRDSRSIRARGRAASCRVFTTTHASWREPTRSWSVTCAPAGYITAASEWMLDNFHLLTSQIGDVRRNLPQTYYRQLPALATREHVGRARIYAMAIELVRHSDSRIDQPRLQAFLNTYQRVAPLTIGELWAWPSMLTLALVENLRRLADEILRARTRARSGGRPSSIVWTRRSPWSGLPAWTSPPWCKCSCARASTARTVPRAAARASSGSRRAPDDAQKRRFGCEHQRQGMAQVSVANAITTLRLCSEIDWRELRRERQSGRAGAAP